MQNRETVAGKGNENEVLTYAEFTTCLALWLGRCPGDDAADRAR